VFAMAAAMLRYVLGSASVALQFALCPCFLPFVHMLCSSLATLWMHPSKIGVVCCEVAAGVLCRAGTVCRQDPSQVGQVDV
jgi:hypothetical protein